MAEKISITRALTMIKTLSDRYKETVENFRGCAVKSKNLLKQPNTDIKPGDFATKTKKEFEKINSLRQQIWKIKVAIEISNQNKIVKIGNKEMTVAEAIIKKNQLPLDKLFLTKLQQLSKSAITIYERENTKLEQEIFEYRNSEVAKDKTEQQLLNREKMIREDTGLEIIDPIEINKLIETLDEDISNFENEVDYVLSESNSTTFIEI